MERNIVAMIGEVETASTVSEEEAAQWREYASLCIGFFVYVPEGYASEAERLLKFKAIRHTGVRTYAYDSEGKILITNV